MASSAPVTSSSWNHWHINLQRSSFLFLQGSQIIRLARVCKQWKKASEDEALFRSILNREFPLVYTDLKLYRIEDLRIIFKKSIQICRRFEESAIPKTILWAYRLVDKSKIDEFFKDSTDGRVQRIQGLLALLQERVERYEEPWVEPVIEKNKSQNIGLFTPASLDQLLKTTEHFDKVLKKRLESIKIEEEVVSPEKKEARKKKKRQTCQLL